MTESAKIERQVKGKVLIDLVKSLNVYRRNRSLVGLSPHAEAFLNRRILANKWYPHNIFRELMRLFYRHLLASNPENAVKAGIVAGYSGLQSIHRGFVKTDDPLASMYSMRHLWASMYNFAEIEAELVGTNSVRFILTGYPDMPEEHAMLTVGWGVAAAQLAGAKEVTYVLEQRPWQGDRDLVYLINV